MIKVLSPLDYLQFGKLAKLFISSPWLYLEAMVYPALASLIWISNRLFIFKSWWRVGFHFAAISFFFALHYFLAVSLPGNKLNFYSFSLRYSLSALVFLAYSVARARGLTKKLDQFFI